jgi:hypothetical protein
MSQESSPHCYTILQRPIIISSFLILLRSVRSVSYSVWQQSYSCFILKVPKYFYIPCEYYILWYDYAGKDWAWKQRPLLCDSLWLSFTCCLVGATMQLPVLVISTTAIPHAYSHVGRQTMRWSLRGVNILSAVRGEYRACRWTEDFLLVSATVT